MILMMSCIPACLTPGNEEFLGLIHHIFCIQGSLACFFCGRFIGVVMSASLLTELSTPFVNVWWLLSIHQKTDNKLYEYNGYMLVLTFFISRIVYMGWLIAWMTIPGIATIDMTGDSKSIVIYTWISAVIYPLLYFLNLFWFYKMIKGAIALIWPPEENSDNKNDTEEKASLLN